MIENQSGFPHLWFEKAGYRGKKFDVLVLRGTFDFAAQGQAMPLATDQRPIVLGDVLAGPANEDPLRAVLNVDGDLLLGKPATDLHVTGNACSENGKAMPDWPIGIRLGTLQKVLRVCGPRRFERVLGGWRLSTPEPTNYVSLDYRLAFGGCFTASSAGAKPSSLYRPDNPAGCGWLPDQKALSALDKAVRKDIEEQIRLLRALPAPQIEDPARAILTPYDRHPTEGLGPVARWWEPRVSFTGTMDEQWRAEVYPAIPDDFDMRYYQSAHPDLIYPGYVEGDEELVLMGCMPEGRVQMRLPGLHIVLAVQKHKGPITVTYPRLDTIALDLDARQASLTWRLPFGRTNAVKQVSIAALTLDAWRAALCRRERQHA